uniref:AB hydrolase-1 domain-containing protein n=1 Tax=Alexandrium catenella TaxID=2925 RepID=A0A7S1WIT9_ALECA
MYSGAFTALEPDPQVLVWDPPSKYFPHYKSGWLNVPLQHDKMIASFETPPTACLRVLMKPAARQPARLGPILLHCGGPGSDATCALPMAWGKWFELKSPYLVGDALSDDYDVWSISQRGMSQELFMYGFPNTSCPFHDEIGGRVRVWPETRCNGIDDLIAKRGVDEVMKRLGARPGQVAWDTLDKIRQGADPQTFGVPFYNETYVRWLYRLVSLEQSLCFGDKKFLFRSPVNDRTYTTLVSVSTVDAAHDIELFRAAIGANKMSIYGVSYGTKIGSVYATIFPSRVHRLILDGCMGTDPNLQTFADWVGQAAEAVWTAMAATCEESLNQGLPPEQVCPAAPGASGKLLKLLTQAETEAEKSLASAMMAEFDSTMFEASVPQANNFMKCLEATYALGDMTDCRQKPSAPVNYPGIHGLETMAQVLGLDIAGRMTEDTFVQWWRFEKASQPIGLTKSLFPVVSVGTWPALPRPDPPAGATDVEPLIIGNLYDGQTPYVMAQKMQTAFPRGRLLTSQFFGHGLQGPKNVQAVIDRYAEEKRTGILPTYDNEVAKLLCVKVALIYLKNGTMPAHYICKVQAMDFEGNGLFSPASVDYSATTTTTILV